MKLTNPKAPVRLSWLAEQGYRLDASTYVSGTYEIRDLLKRLKVPVEPLRDLTAGYDGGLYNGPQFRRIYVADKEYGVPFVGSADMLEADLTNLPLLSRKEAESSKLSYLRLAPGMSLISCSGTVGKVAYVRPDMDGFWSSQDSIKVVADPARILHGYLQAFLRSRYGVPFLTTAKYGTGIRHLEPVNIAEMVVPRFDPAIEREIHEHIEEATLLRAEFQSGVVRATQDLFGSAGIPELADYRWHNEERELGFSIASPNSTSLRALNYSPRAARLVEKLKGVSDFTLGDVCRNGQLARGLRFKRVESDEENGYKLIGQRQAFWLRPQGRWVSRRETPREVLARDETVLVAAQGTLGENEVFCRCILATGNWLEYAYSEHFLRVIAGDPDYPGAYIFAFLRSEVAFRILRSLAAGGKQQDIHEGLRSGIPVPACTPQDRLRIAETVRAAYRARDLADEKEDKALALLDAAVEEAAG